MTARTVTHATFVIERTYPAAPGRVFEAWASVETKSKWFGDPSNPDPNYQLDFQVGGRELNRGGPAGGPIFTFDARFQEIVQGERIAFSYIMDMDATRISLSLATIEFRPEGKGARMTYTEMGAYFDGHDKPEFREHGTGVLLDSLGAYLERQSTDA